MTQEELNKIESFGLSEEKLLEYLFTEENTNEDIFGIINYDTSGVEVLEFLYIYLHGVGFDYNWNKNGDWQQEIYESYKQANPNNESTFEELMEDEILYEYAYEYATVYNREDYHSAAKKGLKIERQNFNNKTQENTTSKSPTK